MNNNIGSGTAVGLVEYLDKIVEKGRATPGAITPLKTAFVKVLEAVDGKEWQAIEVETIDVDEYLSRFAVKTSGMYTDSSISVYKSRVNKVIDWYKQFLKQPGWMPLIKPRAPRAKTNKDTSSEQTPTNKGLEFNTAEYSPNSSSENLERHEIAFSSGEKAVILLPIKRIESDMIKVEKFVDYLRATSNLEGDEGEAKTSRSS